MGLHQIAVLVVEDEPLISLDVVSEMENDGLRVLEAANADEAIAILGEKPEVNVVFTDVDMPGGVSGLELAQFVSERYPEIQIILPSGNHRVANDDLPAGGVFFPKPYAAAAIIQVILATVALD